MKNNIMLATSKTIKVSIVLAFLASLLPVANVSAQKKQLFYSSGAPIEVGDSVLINRDSLRYETGERKLNWVYDQIHEVRQVSSKFHPDGILLRGIYSWVKPGALSPMNEAKKPQPQIPDPVYSTFDVTVNYGETYTWNGTTYAESGAHTQTFKAVSGGDSIVTLNLTVRPQTIYTSFNDSVEVEDTYRWNDQVYTEAGTYTQQFLAKNGADSIVTLNLSTYRLPKPYQVNRFTIGVRGGFASSMAKPATLPAGFDVLLDLQYAHYWAKDTDKIRLGLLTGLSIGYMNTVRNQVWDDTYTVATDNGEVQYHVTADNIKETNHQLQLEVPVMFSMITKGGLFFNVGPRFILPAYTPYKQVITNGNIVATDLETGVVLQNNPVYGQLSTEQVNQKGKGEQQFDLTVTLGFELGYEFKLKSGNSIGLGGFFNYGLYNMYSNQPLGSAIDVLAPSASGSGVVNVESLTNAYTSKMGHLDAGVKVTYNLDFIKK